MRGHRAGATLGIFSGTTERIDTVTPGSTHTYVTAISGGGHNLSIPADAAWITVEPIG